MEKVNVKSVINSGRKWQDKDIFTVELTDGRKCSCFDSTCLTWSGEMELEVKEGKEYQGVKQWSIQTGNKPQQAGKFPPRDFTYDKRNSSLNHAIAAIKLTDQKVSTDNILSLAESFFNYLNKK
jgi:hypothetical protein